MTLLQYNCIILSCFICDRKSAMTPRTRQKRWRKVTVVGYRMAGSRPGGLAAAGVTSPIEPALTRRLPPWSSPAGVTFAWTSARDFPWEPGPKRRSRGLKEGGRRQLPGRPATMRDLGLDRRFSRRRGHQRRSRRADRVPRRRDS